MRESDSLSVWSENRLVAYLWRDQSSPQGLGFRYSEDWVKNGGFAISQRLPLTTEELQAEAGGAVQQFLQTCYQKAAQERVLCATSKFPIQTLICCGQLAEIVPEP